MTNPNHAPPCGGSTHPCMSRIAMAGEAKGKPLSRSLKALGQTVANVHRKRVLIHARVSDEAAGQVIETARDQGISVSEFLRQAITGRLARAGRSAT